MATEINKADCKIPEEIARSFFLDRDIKLLSERIDDIKQFLLMLVHNNDRLQKKFNELYDEKWADKTLQDMKKELEQTKQDLHRGFPISKKENEQINKWKLEHDEKIHNNPTHYHGCSGGGYEYTFYPTGIGTIGYCFCITCKAKAIREKGKDWYDYCNKELHGVFEFGDFG